MHISSFSFASLFVQKVIVFAQLHKSCVLFQALHGVSVSLYKMDVNWIKEINLFYSILFYSILGSTQRRRRRAGFTARNHSTWAGRSFGERLRWLLARLAARGRPQAFSNMGGFPSNSGDYPSEVQRSIFGQGTQISHQKRYRQTIPLRWGKHFVCQLTSSYITGTSRENSAGILKYMGAQNRVRIGFLYGPARLHSSLKSILGFLKSFKIRAQISLHLTITRVSLLYT